jgi:GTP cyclohydrolase I
MRINMAEEKKTQPRQPEVIALPPLRMILAHAKDHHVNKEALAAAIKKFLPQQQDVGLQAISRIIEFLKKRPQEK